MTPEQAADLIARHGETVTVRLVTPGTPNPATLVTPAPTIASVDVAGVIRGYSHSEVDGETIRSGDRKVLIDPTSLPSKPDADDQVTVGGSTVGIVSVREHRFDGQLVAYDVQVRGIE